MTKPKRSSRKKKEVLRSSPKLKRKPSLEQYSISSDKEEEEQPKNKLTAASGSGITPSTEKSLCIPTNDKTIKKYPMWENSANLCWLDASMALLVHNKTFVDKIDKHSSAQAAVIIRTYYDAMTVLNNSPTSEGSIDEERVQVARDLLKGVQESTLKYLQPILKYKEGEPDSAFCSLFNLISEDKSVKDFFDLEFTWVQTCTKCNNHRAKKHKKPIVTLPRVAIFQPSSPIAMYQCNVCKEPDQSMMLNFRTLPQCLLFHFESGAGEGEFQCVDFEIDGRTYRMTGVMTLQKPKGWTIKHFITFIRDASSDTWMVCNDLDEEIMEFKLVPPIIDLEDVYIIMYEADDRLGTVPNNSLALEMCELGEESGSGGADIPLIDLSDDSQEVPLAMNTELDETKVPDAATSNKSASKELNSNETYNYFPVGFLRICPDTKNQRILKAGKSIRSEVAAGNTVKISSEKAAKPRMIYRHHSLYVPSIFPDMEIPVAVDIKKRDSVEAEKPVPKRVKCIKDIDYTSPKMFRDKMGQTANANIPKETYILPNTDSKSSAEVAVCVPESIIVERRSLLIVKVEKCVSAEEGKCIEDSDSTTPNKFGDMMEHTADENIPKETYSERNLEAARPKSPLQHTPVPNYKIVHADFKKESKSDLLNIKLEDSTNLTVTTLEKQFPPNKDTKSSPEVSVKGLAGSI